MNGAPGIAAGITFDPATAPTPDPPSTLPQNPSTGTVAPPVTTPSTGTGGNPSGGSTTGGSTTGSSGGEQVAGPTVTTAPTNGQVAGPSVNTDRLLRGRFANSVGAYASVARLYMAVFNRQPDAAGHAYWVERHQRGLSLLDIADYFVQSPEFVNTYSSLNTRQFVDLLYRNVFVRTGDREGVAYWNGRLDGGTSRAYVTLLFSDSPEFRQLTATN